MRVFWNIQIIFWGTIITAVEILCLEILMGELIVKLGLNFLDLSWVVDLKLCAVFTKMVWLTTSSTFIEMCWNSGLVKLMLGRVMLNGFQWPSSAGASNRQSKDLLNNLLTVPFVLRDVRYHIMVALIQLFIKLTELIEILWIIIGNQVCFNQLTWKLSLKLMNKQVQWLLRHIIKQGFNLVNQSCKLHSKNRKLIIILHVKSFSFFMSVSFCK